MDDYRTEENVVHVEFRPDEPPRRRRSRGLTWGLLAGLAIVVAIGLFARVWPFLAGVLCVSAALAGLSTLRAARHRRRIRERFGGDVPPVTARTYFMYMVAWFAGLVAIVPLFAIGAVIAIVGVVVVGVISVVLLVAALLRAD